jgi:hypothetical protein
VSGDGVPDLLRETEGEESWAAEVLSLPDGRLLWTAPGGWLMDGGQQDGSQGHELLLVEDHGVDGAEEPPVLSTSISSLEGATGAIRWTEWSRTAPAEG